MAIEHVEDRYEAPELTEFGTIEEWTKAPCPSLICVSVIL